MRLLFLILLIFSWTYSQSQETANPEMIEFKILSTKEEITEYFNELIKKTGCASCKIENNITKDGDIVLSVSLPSLQSKIMGSRIAAFFYYSEKLKIDICYKMIVFISKDYLTKYFQSIRNNSEKMANGEFKHLLGKIDKTSYYCIYKFDSSKFESSFLLEATLLTE